MPNYAIALGLRRLV